MLLLVAVVANLHFAATLTHSWYLRNVPVRLTAACSGTRSCRSECVRVVRRITRVHGQRCGLDNQWLLAEQTCRL